MTRRRSNRGGGDERPPATGGLDTRSAIERAWFAAVMLNADPTRIAQLERMLRPAANDEFIAAAVPADGEPPALS